MPSLPESCALDCCECGVVVGTEGPQRGTLLLPCQHVLHMGCVEFIKRRGKLLMGMDSADVVEEDTTVGGAGPLLSSSGGSSASANCAQWAQQMRGRCFCPACNAPIAQMIPLYLRSEDDTATATKTSRDADKDTSEEDFKRVHSAQKRVLLRLRGLCEQRRRMTDLTHNCAALHEQRARYLSEVEKEERCFPGLLSSSEKEASSSKTRDGLSAASHAAPTALPIENMGITELELYMAQVTPRLLRTQAEVRRERHLVERRTKKLNALRTHYHSTKELHALNAEIAERQAQLRGESKKTSLHHDATLSSPAAVTDGRDLVSAEVADAHPVLKNEADVEEEGAPRPPPCVPLRKKMRGEMTIDVDDEPPAEVVEIHSAQSSDAEEEEVDDDDDVVVVVDTADNLRTAERDVNDRGAREAEEDEEDDSSAYEAPYLIPCYVRPSASAAVSMASSSASSSASVKTPHSSLTHNHVRMLPRREDRLWQPSLQF